MSSTTDPELITLKAGLVVSFGALATLWSLEDRQFAVRVDGDVLVVRPRSRLTAGDDAAIREHRAELVALVGYCEEVM